MTSPERRANRAPALLLAVLALAVLEWIAAARAYRTTIAEEDWRALGDVVASLPPQDRVVFADAWLAPRARMMVPPLARLDAVAPPDLREPATIHVLGLDGRAWSDALQAELEDRPVPKLERTLAWGALTLSTYAWPHPAPALASFVDDAMALAVESEGHACEGQRTFKCRSGRIRSHIVEVDYVPRRCLEIDVTDGATVRMTYPDMPLGNVLRGHVGWGDFNRRLRSDAPSAIEITIDDVVVTRWVATDAEGWRPFAVATTPGSADVTIAITPTVQGTWDAQGYATRNPHPPCIEARALTEAPPP